MAFRSSIMNQHGEKKLSQKRPSSPLMDQAIKKKAIFNGTMTVRSKNDEVLHNAREVFHSTLIKQMELVEKLVFKDNECQKLKRKFDEVDGNCRKWHDFAIGLQSRVKRLALILHRQQDSMKNLRNKEVSTVNVSTQTDIEQTVTNQKSNQKVKDEHCKLKSSYSPKPRPEFQSSNTNAAAAVVIDLTSEENLLSTVLKTLHGMPVKPVDVKSSHAIANGNPGHLPQNVSVSNSMNSASVQIRSPNAATIPNHKVVKSSTNAMNAVCTSSYVRPTHHVMPVSSKASKHTVNIDHTLVHLTNQATVLKTTEVSVRNASMKNGNNTPYPSLPVMPLPPPNLQNAASPPRPLLNIKKSKDGIELSWNHARAGCQIKIESYELYVYQHNPSTNGTNRWKKIGNDSIKAMPLPMACTLSQFSTGSKYYFAVRGKDVYGRYGIFSEPCCSAAVQ